MYSKTIVVSPASLPITAALPGFWMHRYTILIEKGKAPFYLTTTVGRLAPAQLKEKLT
jgi:hypothetical protein